MKVVPSISTAANQQPVRMRFEAAVLPDAWKLVEINYEKRQYTISVKPLLRLAYRQSM